MTPKSRVWRNTSLSGNGTAPDGLTTVRRLLLGLVALGSVGLSAELVLLEHFEDWRMWAPLAALAAGLAAVLVLVLFPSRATVRAFRIVMLAFLVAGAAGIWFHYTGNLEFEAEIHPELEGLALVWSALRGATPALAPGAMLQLGLLGLIASVGHPAASGRRPAEPLLSPHR